MNVVDLVFTVAHHHDPNTWKPVTTKIVECTPAVVTYEEGHPEVKLLGMHFSEKTLAELIKDYEVVDYHVNCKSEGPEKDREVIIHLVTYSMKRRAKRRG